MQKISVQTAQNVTIDYPIASVGDRMLAFLIDFAILIGWTMLMAMLMAGIMASSPIASPNPNLSVVFVLIIYLPWFFYNLTCEIFLNGQSLGKRAMKIRVISLDGKRPRIGGYFLRWVFRLIDVGLASGSISIVVISSGTKGQRLGDIVAHTSVVKLRRLEAVTGSDLYKSVGEKHEVVYSEVARLSDRDVQVIQEALRRYKITRNLKLLEAANERVRQVLGLNPEQNALDFLQQVVKDHIHQAQAFA